MWPGVEDHHNVAENEKCYVNLSRLEQRVDRPRERCPQFKSEISFPSHSAASTMSFNSGVKSHSALSPVTTTETNSSDSWGNDWGETNSNSMNLSDEARKRREEKKAERQKEIEAKRAAKKGPMKLGARKNLD